ncbi:hypothetical protein [Umezawaea tangerina]|uniref:MYXO-CTERM domain-containing protein n=1 Tax=Umezawaea tangerina TaxID=84725 RepID=A0A2T0T7Z1_9PSEU|nr:hypothetical protein [Umezawaea tangerina]PRY41738.1 hypothetical protein CLV43_105497 [Umezawaea tangerina]
MAIRVVRATLLTTFLALAFLLLVVAGSANASDRAPEDNLRLTTGTALLLAQTDTPSAPVADVSTVVQKSGPAADSTARTIDIVVVVALGALALWVWVRNSSTRKGH